MLIRTGNWPRAKWNKAANPAQWYPSLNMTSMPFRQVLANGPLALGAAQIVQSREAECARGVCVTVWPCRWGRLDGVTIVFQAPCLQTQPSLHLGTTGDTTAIRSLCCWLIVHDISMERLLQGHVYPFPHHCVGAKNGILHPVYSEDSGSEIYF